ncbi:unnamed protein product [Ixodes pacificus]
MAQDPSLIRGSLRDNLDPTGSHTDDEIWEALRRVHLDHVVRGNPKGLQLDTGEAGANLRILVLGEGRVLEFGPIAELLSRPSSHFRRMAYEAGALPPAYDLEESCTTHL